MLCIYVVIFLFLLFLLFCFCLYLLFVSSVVPELPGDDVLRWLLFVVAFPSGLLSSLLFFSERIPGLVWFSSFYLVTTAGFIRSRSVDVRTCILRAFADL